MTKRVMLILCLSFVVLPFSFQASHAQQSKKESVSFRISGSGLEVSDYKKVVLSVELDEFGSDYATNIDLSTKRIRTECQSRLSKAGLEPVFEFTRPEYLYVNVKVSLHAFSLLLQFSRPVLFQVGEVEYERYCAKTWQRQITGTHGGGPEYILHCLGLLLDAFLKEYLQANAPQ
jgi:hypothetical protein